ncbi:hypothetical protein FE783_20810 [Paenibacillus mesophilus]|uniref:hypothetical protein n=1 Tax=Paenibacillus mesophilus TaxID=2582849 RepID=UPI00110DA46B|nr:hypothetical protein [Paenibacillus mesophilus]TMV47870.1 hypothetical protein FE783_20810 [Paenibacillus mesophilus]
MERCKRFWQMYGRGEDLLLFEDEAEHMYTLPLAQAAAAFFSRHLLSEDRHIGLDGLVVEEGSEVWCTASGQVRGDFATNRGVYDENSSRLSLLEEERSRLPERTVQSRTASWLREQVCNRRFVCELNPRHKKLGKWDGLDIQSSIWWSQPGLFSHGFLFSTTDSTCSELSIGIWEGGTTQLQPCLDWIRGQISRGAAVLVLDLTGTGALSPNAINPKGLHDTFGTLHKLNMDLFWLGDSIAAIRVYDVLRALVFARKLENVDPDRISIYAKGRYSIYAELACAIESQYASRLTVEEEWESVGSWVRSMFYESKGISEFVLPGLLRLGDLPNLRRARHSGN